MQTMLRARVFTEETLASVRLARIAIITITTKSSTSVKPLRFWRVTLLQYRKIGLRFHASRLTAGGVRRIRSVWPERRSSLHSPRIILPSAGHEIEPTKAQAPGKPSALPILDLVKPFQFHEKLKQLGWKGRRAFALLALCVAVILSTVMIHAFVREQIFLWPAREEGAGLHLLLEPRFQVFKLSDGGIGVWLASTGVPDPAAVIKVLLSMPAWPLAGLSIGILICAATVGFDFAKRKPENSGGG